MSYVIYGYVNVDGVSRPFWESVEYNDDIFRVVDDRLKEVKPLFTRADRRVLDDYDAIWTGPNVDAMVKRGVYLDFPSGIHLKAKAIPA